MSAHIAPHSLPVTARPPRSALLLGIARRSPTFAAGLLIVLAFALAAILAPWLAPHDPVQSFPDKVLLPPQSDFPLGTDGNGMDLASRLIFGSRYAFAILLPVGLLSLAVGLPLGLLAGYRGGWVDEVLMRAADVLRAFPTIILALAVVAAAGPSLINVVIVVGLLDSPIFMRLVRAEVLALRRAPFVVAARAQGCSTARIILVHILPNAILGATAQLPIRMAWAVRISATLAFIGVGIQAPAPEWGAMIRQGAEYVISGEWWVATFPGFTLILLVIGLNLLGDGVQDLLDPRRRASGK